MSMVRILPEAKSNEKFPLKSFFFYVVYFVTFLSCVFRSAQYKNFDRFAVND